MCVRKIISIQLEELLLSYIIRNDTCTLARNTYEKIKVQSSQHAVRYLLFAARFAGYGYWPTPTDIAVIIILKPQNRPKHNYL